MAFFLVSKGSDQKLSLLSQEVFDSRSDAMAALAAITADPGFDGWDDEVMVANVEQATPVLLVRPQLAPVIVEDESGDADACIAVPDEPEVLIEEVIAEELIATELGSEDVPEMPVMSDAIDVDSETAVFAAVDEVDAPGDAFVAQVDDAWAAAVVAAIEAPATTAAVDEDGAAGDSLRDALLRTTSQMEAQGVVVPESVPAPEPVADVAVAPMSVDDPMPASEVPSEVVDPMSAAVPVWPWDVGATAEDAESEPEPDESAIVADEPADIETALTDDAKTHPMPDPETALTPDIETVATPDIETAPAPDTAPTPAFDLDAPEERLSDDSPLIRVRAGDDVVDRTVVLGAYGEVSEPAEPADAPVVPAADADVPQSDFILDLDQVEPAATPAPAGYEPSSEAVVDSMTCDDCVYTQTCPNKGERTPATCGSFQWK